MSACCCAMTCCLCIAIRTASGFWVAILWGCCAFCRACICACICAAGIPGGIPAIVAAAFGARLFGNAFCEDEGRGGFIPDINTCCCCCCCCCCGPTICAVGGL